MPVTRLQRWQRSSRAWFARRNLHATERKKPRRISCLHTADWLSSRLEAWTVTDRGELVKGKPRHYVRITPQSPSRRTGRLIPIMLLSRSPMAAANTRPEYRRRDFLQLVRLGCAPQMNPLIVDSVAVIDQVLKHDLPQGPCWRRYNHDGYGQKTTGAPSTGRASAAPGQF